MDVKDYPSGKEANGSHRFPLRSSAGLSWNSEIGIEFVLNELDDNTAVDASAKQDPQLYIHCMEHT